MMSRKNAPNTGILESPGILKRGAAPSQILFEELRPSDARLKGPSKGGQGHRQDIHDAAHHLVDTKTDGKHGVKPRAQHAPIMDIRMAM